MRKIASFLVLITLSVFCYAQQDPQVSLNQYNQLTINPAFAGANTSICASFLHRNQWMGFGGKDGGAPRTDILNAHGAIGKGKTKHGVGLVIMQEEIGFEKNFTMNANYAFILPLGPGKLSLGLSVGFISKGISADWQTPDMLENPDNSFPFQDPLVPQDKTSYAFDAGFGVFYRTDDFYAGLSSTHLPASKFNFDVSPSYYLKRHYYIQAGYFAKINQMISLKPGIFIKTDGKSTQYDINLICEWQKKLWGGLSYRVTDAVVVMAGYTFPFNLRIGMAYDFTTSDLGSYSNGSFEVYVGYCFNINVQSNRGSYKSVRFL